MTQHAVPSIQYSAGPWRLWPYRVAEGPDNAALDEALLAAVGRGDAPPTLRFYGWQRPWISLGCSQPSGDLDGEALTRLGWGVYRRASGGAAVLHTGQIGYAIALPAGHPLVLGDLVESYARLSRPLQAGLRRLGVDTTPAPPHAPVGSAGLRPMLAGRVCFAALGPFELVGEGMKIVGNAQVRRRGVVLQHGVIQIDGDPTALVEGIAASAVERAALAAYLAAEIGTLTRLARRALTPEMVVQALVDGFAEVLDLSLEPGTPTAAELGHARSLVATKYTQAEWTRRH